MSTLIIDRRDISLDYENSCILIRHPELTVRSVPLSSVKRILCLHGVTLSTRLLGHCQQAGVDFIALNLRYSEFSFALHANHLQQAMRRQAQYRLTIEASHSLPLARLLISTKLGRARYMLRRQTDSMESRQTSATLLARRKHLHTAQNLASLRGIEGTAQRELFDYWRSCLPAQLGFTRRARRPPPDPVNALLSLTYTLVYHEAVRQCLAHGLDPWLGIYHQLSHGRMSLACDLMEPLRPEVEAWVVERFTCGDFSNRHFSTRDGGCHFGKAGRESFYTLWHLQQPDWSRRLSRYAAWLARWLEQQTLPGSTLDAA